MRPLGQSIRAFVVLSLLTAAISALGGTSGAVEAPEVASRIEVRSLGAAVGPRTLTGIDELTVPAIDPAGDRLLLLWVMHREDDAASRLQTVTDIAHPSIASEDWNVEFYSGAHNAQRFALFWTVTGTADPAAGDLTLRFSSTSERTLAIVVEASGVDLTSGEKPFTNLVADERFGDPDREGAGPTSKTHRLQTFVDPDRNAALAFQFAGREDTTITPEAGLELLEHTRGGPFLTSAAAFDPPGDAPDLNPTFSWTEPASSGGMALELRAAGSPSEFPIQRTPLTQGRRSSASSMLTEPVSPTPGELLVGFVTNKRPKGTPPVPTLSGPGGIAWSRAGTATFDRVASPLKRLTAFVGTSASGESGPVSISFPGLQDAVAWFLLELSGADLSEGALGAVRQATAASGDGITQADVSFLRGHGTPVNATLAAVALEAGDEPQIQPGFARAPSTREPFPIKEGDLSLWGQWRSTPSRSPGMALQTNTDAAIVALEIKERTSPQTPAITDIAPRTGADVGGTEVLISGSDFTDHGTEPEVNFGDVEVHPIEVSATRIRAVAPAHAPGLVDVSVEHDPPAAVVSENTPQDDFTYVPRLSVGDPAPASESEGSVAFPVTLADGATAPFAVSVGYTTTNSTANGDVDFARTSGVLTLEAGRSGGTVTVPLLNDALDEVDESLFLDLSNPQRAVITDARGQATITDDDPEPSLSIGSVSVAEGSSGTTAAAFPVTLSAASGRDVTVGYATADGTATAPSDYHSRSGTITVPAGQTTAQILVPVVGDTADEANERFVVNLDTASNATVATASAEGTIVDDDDSSSSPTLSISDTSVTEGTGATSYAWFTVTLSSPSSTTVTSSFATADGTAVAPHDYTARMDAFKIPAGETSKQFRIAVAGDSLDEPDEAFVANLSNPSGATIADGRGQATILDDDASTASSLSISDVSLSEGGHTGTTDAVFTVSVSPASSQEVRVGYATADGTATASEDYSVVTGTLSIPAGQLSGEIRVPVTGDGRDEADETFFVNLSSPSGASISDGQGQGTIVDDDDPPAVSIGDVSVTEGNTGTTSAIFTVSLSTTSGRDVQIPYSTTDGTATGGSDYTGASDVLTIPAGETSRTISVAVTGDTLDEPDETFLVNLGSATGATVADGRGQGTIVDDDDPPPQPTRPELSIGDASVLEGASGTKTALRLTVTLSAPQATNVTFSYASVDGTATAASGDYIAKSGTATIVAGATTTTVRVDVRGDAIDETEETFFVDLLNPSGATIADGRGQGTIVDDDA